MIFPHYIKWYNEDRSPFSRSLAGIPSGPEVEFVLNSFMAAVESFSVNSMSFIDSGI